MPSRRTQQLSVLTMNTVGFTACFAVWVMFSIIGIPIKTGLELSETQFGILAATPILTGSVLRLPLGMMTDKFGGRPVFFWLMASIIIPLFLISKATEYWQFLILGLFVGAAGASFSVGIAYTARWFTKETAGFAMGIFGAGNAGAALTKFVAPSIVVALGWQMVPVIYAIGMTIVCILFWFFTYSDPDHLVEDSVTVRDQLKVLNDPKVWKYCQYYSIVFGGFVALSLWMTKYFMSVYGHEIQTAALLGLGRTYYETGEYADALDALRRIIDSYPESPHLPDTYFALAQVHEELDRYSEAAEAYQKYLDLRPGLIDSYVHERRGDALTATGAYTLAINSYQEAIQAPRLDDVLPLEIKIGNSYYNLGDYQTALVVYSDVYTRTNSDYVKASMNFMTGLSHIQLGQTQEGYQAYLDSVENYPLSYDTYLGLINLVDAGYPVSEFDRGIVDYFAGQYSLAISAFDRYLLNPGDYAGTALYYKGLAYRAIDNPTAAINAWDQLIRNYPEDDALPDAWEQKGYTQWAFLDQYEQAQETFLQFVKNNPFNARAAEFLFFAGQVAERAEELDVAAEIWMRIPSEYPQSDLLPRAVFLTGINHYRRGDFSMALDTFQQALNYPGDRSALHFWIGKTFQAMGEQTAAEISWREAVGIDPTGYYSERARDILLSREAFSPPLMYDLGYDPDAEKSEAEDWMREVFAVPDGMDISSSGSLVNDPRWIRGSELWTLGLYEDAKAEFEDLRSEISISPIDSYRLANYLIEIGLYRPAIFAARQVLNLNGMDDADTMNAPIYFNHVRFGGYYKELVIPIAEAYALHPLFLFSVMRQ